MLEARAWAAYACTKAGGANECPDAKELECFKADIEAWLKQSQLRDFRVTMVGVKELAQLLWVFDRAY